MGQTTAMRHIMVDLETYDNVATGVIASIGVVQFCPVQGVLGKEFYEVLDIDQQLAKGRTISGETLRWWFNQSKDARHDLIHGKNGKFVALYKSLINLDAWVAANISGDPIIWSKGASFDVPFMEHAYRSHGMQPPWKFWNSRCVRTALDETGEPSKPKGRVAHNALDDAKYQAQVMCWNYHKRGLSAKAKAEANNKEA